MNKLNNIFTQTIQKNQISFEEIYYFKRVYNIKAKTTLKLFFL